MTFLVVYHETARPEIYTLSLHDALPILREAGNGHGWDPWYATRPTRIAVSSHTSRRTAASRGSPGSTYPAGTEKRFAGHIALWARRIRSKESMIAMITAASVRGKCWLLSTGHTRTQPDAVIFVAAPQRGQWVWVACQFASATAAVARPASRAGSSAPTARRLAHAGPSSPAG